MKQLLVFIIMIFCQDLFCQCEYKVDEFTKDITASSKLEKIGREGNRYSMRGTFYIKSKVMIINNVPMLILYSEFSQVTTIEKGESVYIKFVNDSIIEMKALETQITKFTSGEAFTQGTEKTIWYTFVQVILSQEQFLQLQNNKIVKIRVHNSDYEIKEKDSGLIMDQIECVQKAMLKKK